jgi:hypothetical protein
VQPQGHDPNQVCHAEAYEDHIEAVEFFHIVLVFGKEIVSTWCFSNFLPDIVMSFSVCAYTTGEHETNDARLMAAARIFSFFIPTKYKPPPVRAR